MTRKRWRRKARRNHGDDGLDGPLGATFQRGCRWTSANRVTPNSLAIASRGRSALLEHLALDGEGSTGSKHFQSPLIGQSLIVASQRHQADVVRTGVQVSID